MYRRILRLALVVIAAVLLTAATCTSGPVIVPTDPSHSPITTTVVPKSSDESETTDDKMPDFVQEPVTSAESLPDM